MKGSCNKCAKCCQYLVIHVPEKLYGSKDILNWLKYHGIDKTKASLIKGFIKLYIPLPCKKLQGNLCTVYDRRPMVCRTYPQEGSELPEGCGYANKN